MWGTAIVEDKTTGVECEQPVTIGLEFGIFDYSVGTVGDDWFDEWQLGFVKPLG